MTDNDPLAQFHAWYDKQQLGPGETPYTIARAAFFAGHAARPADPIAPSRDALDPPGYLARYRESVVRKYDRPYQPDTGYQAGPYGRGTTFSSGFPVRKPVPQELRRVEPVAGPSQETLARIHDKLRAEGQVDYPVDSTNPGFPAVTGLLPVPDLAEDTGLEHVATVWDGEMAQDDELWRYWGASGPVQTPLSVQDGEN